MFFSGFQFLFPVFCFAQDYKIKNSEQYKKEIEAKIAEESPKIKANIDSYFEKAKKFTKNTCIFQKPLLLYVSALEECVKIMTYHADRRCSEWLSVIIVARALPLVLRSPTPIDVPIGPGSPM